MEQGQDTVPLRYIILCDDGINQLCTREDVSRGTCGDSAFVETSLRQTRFVRIIIRRDQNI